MDDVVAAAPYRSGFRDVPAQPRAPRSESVPGPAPGRDADAPVERPSPARVWDFLLDGVSHGAVDRARGRDLRRLEPAVTALARASRSFSRRAVGHLLDAGIDQFLDLGAGIPTVGSTHEVIARRGGSGRVAYTDIDPSTARQGSFLLAGTATASYSAVDLRDPDAVLRAPGVAGLLDLDRPVGVLACSVLEQVGDGCADVVGDLVSALAPGSAVALCHLADDDPRVVRLRPALGDLAGTPLRPRSRDDVAALLRSTTVVAPGVVRADHWRPDRPPPPGGPHTHWAALGVRR